MRPASLPLSRGRPARRACVAAVLLVVSVALAYLPSFSGGFLLDDDVLLTNNSLIRSPDGLRRFWFTSDAVDYWPVSNSSLWLEWRLWGSEALGYRVTNLVLHCCNSFVAAALLRALAIPGAFGAALVFALHPVNVEAVAWIAQRKTLLASFFALLAALAYLRSESPAARGSATRGRAFYLLALAAFALAMLSKASVVTLPFLLAALVAWRRPLERRDAARLAPFVVVAATLLWINLRLRTADPGIDAGPDSLPARLLGAAGAFWFYLGKALLPVNLAFIYPWPAAAVDAHSGLLPAAAALAVAIVLVAGRRQGTRPALCAAVCYGLAMLPALGLTERLVVTDHYQYPALLAVAAATAAAWTQLRRRLDASRVLSLAATALGPVVLAVLGVLTWRQAALYSDTVTLMRTTVEAYPSSAAARRHLGFALLAAGRLPEARESLEAALRLAPDHVDARRTLAAVLCQDKDFAAALDQLRLVLRARPDDPFANHDLGALLRETGRPAEAVAPLENSLRLRPREARTHVELAKALLATGRTAQAVAHLRVALGVDSSLAEAHRLLVENAAPGSLEVPEGTSPGGSAVEGKQ